MDTYKIIEVKESVFADNDREAARVREALKQKGTFLLNLMSSPGSGKTTTLLRTIEALKDELRMGVMEADIDSDVDAAAIAGAGVRTIWTWWCWKMWGTWCVRRSLTPAR